MKNIRNWFRQDQMENSLDRELRYHVDRRVADLTAAGMPETKARRQAVLELGGLAQVREEVRDTWLTRWLRDFVYDLRFSTRSFLHNPSFTATVVLSLALGIGATTAIYSLADQVMLRAIAVRDPNQLVMIDWKGEQAAHGRGSFNIHSYPLCRDLNRQDRFFNGVLCRHLTNINLSVGQEPKPATAEIVSGNYFSTLGVLPAMGRLFTDSDDQEAGASPVVVLSHDFWQNQMAAAADIIGRTVLVNQHRMTVIGIAAAGFRGVDVGEVPVIWIPAAMIEQAMPGFNPLKDRRMRWMQILGRLRPGLTAAEAQSGLQPWFKAMLQEDTKLAGFPSLTPEQRQRFLASTLSLIPAPQGHSPLRRRMEQPLWVLAAGTVVLLGLACLNVAGLFLARGSARDKEIKTRMALGASRGRVARQLLADSLLYALAGGVLGLVLAPLAMRTLIAFLPQDTAANNLQSTLDPRLLLFALFVTLLTGLLSGLVPALQAGRDQIASSLRSRGETPFGGVRLRKLLVTVQIAFTLILVIGAALFVRSFNGLLEKGPGFSTSSLVAVSIDPLLNGYSREQASQLMKRVHTNLSGLPGVRSAAFASMRMLEGGSWNNQMTFETPERITTDRTVHINAITPEFFSTLGTNIISGRDFEWRDTQPVGQLGVRSVIVNETLVRRYFGQHNPIGRRLAIGNGPDAKPDIEIVGVVADFSYRGVREQSEQAYFPAIGSNVTNGVFYVRVLGTPEAAFPAIRSAVRAADPAVPITTLRTLDEQVNRSLNMERMLATVSGGFGAVALILSLVGLYGVMSFVVTQRTREIGVRLALGATPGSAVWLVLRDAVIMVAAGTLIALPCVWALGRLVESQLFGVEPTDAATLATAILVLGLAALGAAMIPARRASSVDPAGALRSE